MKIIALDVKVMVSSLSPFRVHLPKWPKEKMMTIYRLLWLPQTKPSSSTHQAIPVHKSECPVPIPLHLCLKL